MIFGKTNSCKSPPWHADTDTFA